jgi:hypothetical protein
MGLEFFHTRMPARVGIELSALTCRVIELGRTSPRRGEGLETRVSSFRSLPLIDLDGALSSLRGRHAVVVLWTPHMHHQLVTVSTGPYERMRAEALQAMAAAGLATVPVLSDIAPTGPKIVGADRVNILVATAPRNEVAAALRPLKNTGIEIDAVLTPAAALAALARLRRDVTSHRALEAYIAFEETESMMALVRDGQLVAARMLPWGYLRDAAPHHVLRPRDEIVTRLVNDLSTCRTSAQLDARPLTQVCVCGGLPELRSTAIALTEQLDVEVEPLDRLFSIDATRLPEPEEEFRERAAGFRLAWAAAAADGRPTLDLFRERRRQARKVVFSQAAVVAGVAVGLGTGWLVQKRWRPIELPKRIAQTAVAPALSAAPARPTFLTPPALSQPQTSVPAIQSVMAPRAQSASAIPEAPTRRSIEPAVSIQPEKPVERPLAALVSTPPPRLPAPVERPPARVPLPPARPALVPPSPPAASFLRQQNPAVPAPAVEAQPSPLPFEATLGTILYGPERKLAIVDGRIVQAGDDVRGARVVEITPTSVYLRDEQGRLRRLTAGGSGR